MSVNAACVVNSYQLRHEVGERYFVDSFNQDQRNTVAILSLRFNLLIVMLVSTTVTSGNNNIVFLVYVVRRS